MSLNFQHLPNVGDIMIVNGITYVWNVANLWFSNFPGLAVSTGNAYQDANGIWFISSTDVNKQGDTISGDITMANANIYFAMSNGIYGIYFDNGNSSITFSNGSIQITNFTGGGGGGNVTAAFIQANTARDQANAAYAAANAATGGSVGAAYAQANTARDTANLSFNTANASFIEANALAISVNTAQLTANNAYNTANAAFINSNVAGNFANAAATAAYTSANNISATANNALNTANLAFNNSNVAGNFANAAATAAYNSANAISATANTALTTANLAFNKANGAVQLGFTAVAANGNGATVSASSNSDTLIFANTGNVVVTANAAGGKNLYIDLTATGVTQGIYGSGSVIPIVTVDSRGRVTSISNVAATGGSGISSVFANTPTGNSISTGTNLVLANSANIYIANSGSTNMVFEMTTTGATAGVYGAPTVIPIVTVDSRGRVTAISNVNASAGSGVAQFFANTPTSVSVSPGASGLVLQNTANIYVSNTGTTNLFHELTTTGVTAAAYGNSLFGATFTVDSRGRIVTAAPVLMGDAIDAYNTANSAFGNSNVAGNYANTLATGANQKAQSAVQLGFTSVAANGNGVVITAASNSDTLIFANTGNIVVTANAAGGKNLYLELTTTAVTQGIYGSGTVIPIITVDSRGRVTSISNVAASGGSGITTVLANTPTGNAVSTGSTLILANSANIYIANSGSTNMIFEMTTTGATAGIYGAPTVIPIVTVDSRGRVTSISNVAASAGSGVAQFFANTPTSVSVSPGASGLVLQNTANIYVSNTGTTNLFHELTTTGVTAGAYGNAVFGTTLTIDSRGRIVSAAPVLMGDAIDAYNTANAAFTKANAALVNATTTFGGDLTVSSNVFILGGGGGGATKIQNPNARIVIAQTTDQGAGTAISANGMIWLGPYSAGIIINQALGRPGSSIAFNGDGINEISFEDANNNQHWGLRGGGYAQGNTVYFWDYITARNPIKMYANTDWVDIPYQLNVLSNLVLSSANSGYLKTDAVGNVTSDGMSLQLTANNAYNTANAAFAKANTGGSSTVNSGASLMFAGGSNSAYYFTGYSPKSLTIFGARAFVQMAGEIGRCANINIAINGTVVTGLTQMFANTLNTKAITLSTGANSVVSGDIITAIVANNTVDSGNNIVVALQLQ